MYSSQFMYQLNSPQNRAIAEPPPQKNVLTEEHTCVHHSEPLMPVRPGQAVAALYN